MNNEVNVAISQWIQYGAFGLLSIIVFGVAWFLAFHVWPFVTRQFEDNKNWVQEQVRKSDEKSKQCEDNILEISRDFMTTTRESADATKRVADEFCKALDRISK